VRLAVIGGTGVYDPRWFHEAHEVTVATPYGSVTMTEGLVEGCSDPVLFVNRHGAHHHIPPHRVNYRANVWALKTQEVSRVIATAAVGSLNPNLPPGSMVLVDQFLDFTKSRPSTFFDGGPLGVVHTDMTAPYCPHARQILAETGHEMQCQMVDGGVYVATEGPRFESGAEIRAFRMLGGDVVGMTGVPEVVLAREAGLCYSTIALVTNFAAGIAAGPLTHREVLEVMAAHADRLKRLMASALPRLAAGSRCGCLAPPSPPM
jgi:5'-methylthioadenosine phosphorylase